MELDGINLKLAKEVIRLEKENLRLFKKLWPERNWYVSESVNSAIYIALKFREQELLKQIEMKNDLLNEKNSRQAVT